MKNNTLLSPDYTPFCAKLSGMSGKKLHLRLPAVYAIAFVLVYLIPEHMHRRGFDKVFMTWRHDPTPQNEEMLRVEQRKNEIIKLAGSAVVALVLVALGTGIYFGTRFAGRKSDGIPDVR